MQWPPSKAGERPRAEWIGKYGVVGNLTRGVLSGRHIKICRPDNLGYLPALSLAINMSRTASRCFSMS